MRKSVIPRMRRCATLAILLALSVLTLAFSGTDKGKNKAAVHPDEYEDLMTYALSDLYDLEQYFVLHQYDFLPIAPPDPHFILQQPGVPEVLPFSEKTFPKEFVEHLVGTYEYSVLVYPLNIREDPKTREIVFINADGQPIHTLPPAPGYDPYAYLKSRWSSLYSGQASLHAVNYWQAVYDPARVQLRTKLIPTEDVEPYLYARTKAMEAAALAEPEGDFGGGHMMMLMGGEDELAIADMKILGTNVLLLTLAYSPSQSGTAWSAYTYAAPACIDTNESGGGGGGDPPPLPGTNTCTNCAINCAATPTNSFMGLQRIWEVVYTNLHLTGATHTAWTDTRPLGMDAQTNHVNRYYGFGRNADHDGDGLNSGVELFVVKVDPENPDTDGDGIPDGWEWNNDLNPLNASDATDDPDGDGLSNLGEYQNGTDPHNPDTDADGFTDRYEVDLDTDPLDDAESPGLIMIVNNGDKFTVHTNLTIRFPGYLADNAIISEQTNLTNGVTLTFSDPIPFSLQGTSNGVRHLYAKLIRNSATSTLIAGSIIFDNVPPQLGGFSPTNGQTTNHRWIKITGVATDALSHVRVFVNDQWAHGNIQTQFWHDRILLQPGTNAVVIVAKDYAGNAATQTVNIIQDTTGDPTAPSLSISFPGQTTNGAPVVYGDHPVLYFSGVTDDETAEVLAYTIADSITNGPWAAVVAGSQVWCNVTLEKGTNTLIVTASDAAPNLTTITNVVVRDTNFFFTITYPAPYQVMNAASTVVSGIASPMFLNSTITVNGVSTTISTNGSNVVFATISGVPLSVDRTELIGMAALNGNTYYTDPPPCGYEALHYETRTSIDNYIYHHTLSSCAYAEGTFYYDILSEWSPISGYYNEDFYVDTDYCIYANSPCHVPPWTSCAEPEYFDEGYELSSPTFAMRMGYSYRKWESSGANYYTMEEYKYRIESLDYRFIKRWPTQELQTVIFQFPYAVHEFNSQNEPIDPSLITYRGQTGFWYNGKTSFIVPIETEVEYTLQESDFSWPRFDFSTADMIYKGHFMSIGANISNHVLRVELPRGDEPGQDNTATWYPEGLFSDKFQILPDPLPVDIKWTITGLPNSAETKIQWTPWDFQNSRIDVGIGTSPEVEVTYEDVLSEYDDFMPPNNNWFGEKNVEVTIQDTHLATRPFWFFFYERAVREKLNGTKIAAWYHYWKQGSVPALVDFEYIHNLSGAQAQHGWSLFGGDVFQIGPSAITGINKPVFDTGVGTYTEESYPDYLGVGIHGIAKICAHEQWHAVLSRETRSILLGGYGHSDQDGDDLSDAREIEIGTNPLIRDTCNISSYTGGGADYSDYADYGDQELFCRWKQEGVTGNETDDWASPGMQASQRP